jgi:hypothetical protein
MGLQQSPRPDDIVRWLQSSQEGSPLIPI